MSFITMLPREVLKKITGLLPRTTVFQCMFINKSWNSIATHLFYYHLVLTQENLLMLQDILPLQEDTQYCNLKTHGSLVKILTIYNDNPAELESPHILFHHLLASMPFLKCIDIASSHNPIPYLYSLSQFHEATKLEYIEEFRVFNKNPLIARKNNRRIKDFYLSILYSYKASIKHIELLEPLKCYNLESQNNLTYIDILSAFKKLTHLTMHYSTEERINAHVIYSSIIANCPHLVSFDFIHDGIKNTFEAPKKIHPSACLNKNPLEKNTWFTPNIFLKSISLDLPSLDKHQMKYIIDNISTLQLNSFELLLDQVDTFKYWANKISVSKLKKFAHHISQADDIFIRIKQGYIDHEKPISLIHQSKETKHVIQSECLTKIVYAFQGSKKFKDYDVTADLIVKEKDPQFQHISQINTTITHHTMEFQQIIDTDYFCDPIHNILTAKLHDGGSIAANAKIISVTVPLPDVIKVIGFILRFCEKVQRILFTINNMRMVIAFPERRKKKLFSSVPQHGPCIVAMENSLFSTHLFEELVYTIPDLRKFIMMNIHKDNIFPLIDLSKANDLRHLVLDFRTGVKVDPFLYIQMDFINPEIKSHEVKGFKCVVNYATEAITGLEESITMPINCLPELTIVYSNLQSATISNHGQMSRSFFPPVPPKRPQKKRYFCFF